MKSVDLRLMYYCSSAKLWHERFSIGFRRHTGIESFQLPPGCLTDTVNLDLQWHSPLIAASYVSFNDTAPHSLLLCVRLKHYSHWPSQRNSLRTESRHKTWIYRKETKLGFHSAGMSQLDSCFDRVLHAPHVILPHKVLPLVSLLPATTWEHC